MTHHYILVFSTADKVAFLDPKAFPLDDIEEVTGQDKSMFYSCSWVFPMIGEHDFIGKVHGARGGALFRPQMHEMVYESLLSMFIPGMIIYSNLLI